MLSNKLTFSLASLIVLLMVGLCLPASAQTSAARFLPAGSIATGLNVYSHAASDAIDTVSPAADALSNVTPTQVSTGFPYDLADFFALGGTIEIAVPKGSPFAKGKLVISEIMWGIDRGVADPANQRNLQWIEIENKSGAAQTLTAPSGTDGNPGDDPPTAATVTEANTVVYLLFTRYDRKAGDTADYIKARAPKPADQFSTTPTSIGNLLTEGTRVKSDGGYTHMVIDRVSNVNIDAFGSVTGTFPFPGQSGNTAAASPTVTREPLISAQRKGDLAKGHESGSWAATDAIARRNTAVAVIQANPGVSGTAAGIPIALTTTAAPAANKLVINEVRNHSNDDLDWVEVKNVQAPGSTNDIQLDGWELSYTVEEGKEVELVDFPKYKLPPQGILLIVSRDPSDTELAGGVDLDVMVDTDAEQLQKGATHLYIVRSSLKLPNSGDYLLLLRDNHERNNKKEWHHDIEDAAGSAEIEGYKTNRATRTKVWPFQGYGSMGGDKVASFGQTDGNRSAWERKPKGVKADHYTIDNANGRHKGAWNKVSGDARFGVGYDRGVDLTYAPGTPGYENLIANTVDDFVSTDPDPDLMEIASANISISEVMFDAGPRWNLVQWIELYNASMTQTVDLTGWELEIRNAKDDVESYVDSVFTFVADGNPVILPNQTLLIVSGAGTNDVNENRVYNLYEHHRRQLGLTTRRSVLLSPTGFYLRLTDRADLDRDSRADEDVMVDEAGNVMVDGAQRIVQWPLPDVSDTGPRRSIIRQYGLRYTPQGGQDPANVRYQGADEGSIANTGNPSAADVAAAKNGWMDFWRESDIVGAGISFYGHRDDISTPGYRTGGPLPVSLSSFRPARDKATGEVVIRWITQSELNNAGFNILRSETKTGEFKVVNVKGIVPGHGTTSEKHVYEWKDTSAKPNVVYYYQIEDVSLDGKRTTLATTRLKGHVSAAGKVTTTWGDLKHRD